MCSTPRLLGCIAFALVMLASISTQAGPSRDDTVRFLEQSTFGPTPALIAHVQDIGLEAFLQEQFTAPLPDYPDFGLWPENPPTSCDAICQRDNYSMYPLQVRFFRNALTKPDQLRQRVAFALNQIFVISAQNTSLRLPSRMLPYLQVLDRNAFGNFRQLLYEITLNPGMGRYLDMAGNNRSAPNENYARELLQLFTIGLNEQSLDGFPYRDWTGHLIPTYDQSTVTAFARVFTGWVFAPAPAPGVVNYAMPLVPGPANAHDTGPKTLLNGVMLPRGQDAVTDLNAALDNIASHPNVAPFISIRLIQHLVTSNPSAAYIRRVATAFRASGGDMRTVIRAILLDPEARQSPTANYGHLREPVLWITSLLRAFNTTGATSDFVLSDSFLPPDVTMSEDLFRAASVFNFFSPQNVVAGGTLLAPEFGIYSTATALARTNFAYEVIYQRMPTSRDRPLGTWLNLAPLEPLASDPATLIAALDTSMLHGQMTAEMRNVLMDSVSRIPPSDPLGRVRNVVYLIATAADYLVER
jgi:uncharacterized protein (DUF1800 family)